MSSDLLEMKYSGLFCQTKTRVQVKLSILAIIEFDGGIRTIASILNADGRIVEAVSRRTMDRA